MRYYHHYTAVQIAWLRENRSKLLILDFVKQFNAEFGTSLSKSAIHGTCKRLKIFTGKTGLFTKHTPSWNSGLKIGIRPGSEPFLFRKGNKPHNFVPAGTERLKADGYIWVKISDPNIWRQKHRVLWEAKHGPIPNKMRLIFKDGDRENFAEDNFELVTNAELLRLCKNRYLDKPAEIKPAVLTLSKLQVMIFEKSKAASERH